MTWPAFFYPHEVQVQDVIGGGGGGTRHGDKRPVPAEVKDGHQLVRTTEGKEIVSSSQVTVALDAGVEVGAKVTVWPGTPRERTSVVLAIDTNDNTDVPLDDFLVLSLR